MLVFMQSVLCVIYKYSEQFGFLNEKNINKRPVPVISNPQSLVDIYVTFLLHSHGGGCNFVRWIKM